MKNQRPSQTARKVAFNILALGSRKEMAIVLPDGIVSATENLLVLSGAATKRTVKAARGMACVYEAFDWMMPGQFRAFGYRKAFCERQVRESIYRGVTQVLALGAGYDTLGWRLASEFENVSFFEIDHPATARVKARGIAAMGMQKNLYLLPKDLGQEDLITTLANTPQWDPKAQSVIVAEGLLMYLSPDAVKSLFTQCAAVSGEESHLVFTYIRKRQDGRPDAGPMTWLVLQILKWSGEPWLWSCNPQELGNFLVQCGWRKSVDSSGDSSASGIELFATANRSVSYIKNTKQYM